MKDIKELIYAAIEENALKFQEIVNSQLQVRAYDAIEALRPEIGASMFGESSHKKMDDEDEEDMKDMEDEEDEDEKKSKVEEELKGNQHKIDKNKNGKIDGHDFKLLRKEDVEEVEEAINVFRKDPNPQGDHGGTPIRYSKGHSAHGDAHRTATAKAAKVARTQGHLRGNDNHHMGWKNSERTVSDKTGGVFAGRGPKPVPEEVEQIDEIGDTPRGKAALTKLASQRFGRARWAHGVDHYEKRTSSNPPKETAYGKLRDKDNAVAKKAADKAGVAHKDVPNHEYDWSNKGGHGTGPNNPAHKLAARNKVSEEVVNEVAMPQNAADWQALITHQIKTTGHPVATDAQFRAPHGKDTSKIASQHSPEDMLNYATAQGGTVKR